MEERCVMCGRAIPEGRQVCPICDSDFDFTGWLEEELRKSGTKQSEFSQKAGLAQSTLCGYVNRHKLPSVAMFCRILNALGKRLVIMDK